MDQVAGIDFGTRALHLVRRLQGTTTAEWRRIDIPSHARDAEGDALAARDAGIALLADPAWWDGVWLAGVEYPFARAHAVGNKTIMGAIVATIPEHVHVIPLPAGLWTAWFLRTQPGTPLPKVPRKGIERKPLIKARALQLLARSEGPKSWPQDVYDAFGISWAVEAYNQAGLLPPTPPRPLLRSVT